MKLSLDFYRRSDVVQIAKELLGKVLYTRRDGKVTGGIITETEAYAGITDRASHAFNNRRTQRTEIMYAQGGVAYVYLCYGIHHLFNVVTNREDIPHAVLIRSIKPYSGIDTIIRRRGLPPDYLSGSKRGICTGPGTVSQGLGIKTVDSGVDLAGSMIWIEDKGIRVQKKNILETPRIGVDYAGADALLPYRFTAEI